MKTSWSSSLDQDLQKCYFDNRNVFVLAQMNNVLPEHSLLHCDSSTFLSQKPSNVLCTRSHLCLVAQLLSNPISPLHLPISCILPCTWLRDPTTVTNTLFSRDKKHDFVYNSEPKCLYTVYYCPHNLCKMVFPQSCLFTKVIYTWCNIYQPDTQKYTYNNNETYSWH